MSSETKDKEPEAQTVETETQSDFDIDAATADISSELFGQGNEEGKVEPEKSDVTTEGEKDKPSGVKADVVETSPQLTEEEKAAALAAEAETSKDVQALGAPKTWTKEALEKWATVDPVIQAEVLKREEDFLKGITIYKSAAELGQRYDAVVDPYKPILAATNTDPIQLFQSFAANHYLLTRGTPQQKIELAAQMIAGYEIPLPELLNFMADSINEPPSAEVSELRREVGDLRQIINVSQQSSQAQSFSRIDAEIEAFASDPAHPHFNELADDISKLFGNGMAKTLPEAYEMALYANPITRQKELDRLTAEARISADTVDNKRKDKIAKSTADQVTLTPKTRDGTVPTGSIDDTLEETMAAIEARG